MVSTRMDTVTYPDSRVKGELNRWVTARVDVSRTPEVARLFGVAGVPTAVALTPDGRILGSKPNFVVPEAFVAWLRSVRMLVPVE